MSSSSAGYPNLLFIKATHNLSGGYGHGSRIRLLYRKGDAQFSIRINRKEDIRSSYRINISPKSSRNIFAGGCGSGLAIRTTNAISDESIVNSPPITSPWLMLPPSFVEECGGGNDMVFNFYSLADNEVLSIAAAAVGGGGLELGLPLPYENAEFVGCSHGWIALFDNSNSDLFLFNPISGRHIKLPPIHSYGCVTNVIISCSPDEDEKNCRAMMSYGVEDRLAFCWPGRSLDWTPIGKYSDDSTTTAVIRSYKSFVYSSKEKLFFSVTSEDEFDAWDLRDHRYPRRIPMAGVAVDYGKTFLASVDNNEAEIGYLRFLVVSEYSDELFLVRRFVMERVGPNSDDNDDDDVPYKTIGFDVHKYYPKDRAFKYMDKGSLGGLAFFIGINHGFALCVDDYVGLKPDSIYFTDTYSPPDRCGKTYGGHDLGVFSYEDGTVSPCYYPCDVASIQRISPSPMWFTPNIVP